MDDSGYRLRLGRRPQRSELRTVYLQIGSEPSEEDYLLGTVRAQHAAAVVDAWNRGEPEADLALAAELSATVLDHWPRLRKLLRRLG